MSHSAAQHIGTQVALNGTTAVLVAAPKPNGVISTGVASDQSATLALNRTSTAASTTTSVVDSATTPWTASAYIGHIVVITSGALAGQSRLITANTNQALTVEPAFASDPDAITFDIRRPTEATAVIRGWMLNHLATAGVVRLESKGLVSGTMTTRILLAYNSIAATEGSQVVTGGSFLGVPGGDLRVICDAALTGDMTPDGYWITNNVISEVAH